MGVCVNRIGTTYCCKSFAGLRNSAGRTLSISQVAPFTKSRAPVTLNVEPSSCRSYYKITEAILMHHGQSEPPWRLDTAPPWYPDHVLSMLSPNAQSLSLIVCTQDTDQTRYRGMVIYDVRQLSRRRRRQRPTEIRVTDFWSEYDVIRPMVRAGLPNAIPFYDPDSPDYVIIVPQEFFSLDLIKQLTKESMNRRWEPFRVQSQFSRNGIRPSSIPGLTPENVLAYVIVAAVGGTLLFMTGAGILVGLAAGATALTVAETGTTAATTAGAEATIVVPASVASQVAGGASAAGTAAETASLASYQAMVASPIAQKIAASAAVALVVGVAKSAQASSSQPATATVDQSVPVRAIPIDDFKEIGGVPHAYSVNLDGGLCYTDMTKFDVGRPVLFDNKRHWIFGRLSVR